MKQTVHFSENRLLRATNPIKLHLIGGGGTGSRVLTALAQLNHAMTALGHPGLEVTLWDGDTVTEANRGRQLFAQSEVGLSKAAALVQRTNRFFGTAWKARDQRFDGDAHASIGDIYLSCVDNVATRFELAQWLHQLEIADYEQQHPAYWMDFGNGRKSGQVILSTIGDIPQPDSEKFITVSNMPFVTTAYGELLRQSEAGDDAPSCSLAEALRHQDLFINGALAQLGASLLWDLFRNGMTHYSGFFLNLGDFRAQPVPLRPVT